jgi:hypothetical protein
VWLYFNLNISAFTCHLNGKCENQHEPIVSAEVQLKKQRVPITDKEEKPHIQKQKFGTL